MRRYIQHQRVASKQRPVYCPNVYVIAQAPARTDLRSRLTYWASSVMFNLIQKWGYATPHFTMETVDCWALTESTEKSLSLRVVDAIREYEADVVRTISPADYVVVIGEPEFFELIGESRMGDSPFFRDSTRMPLDVRSWSHGQIMNWDVYVVPHMSGFAIIPKTVINKHF